MKDSPVRTQQLPNQGTSLFVKTYRSDSYDVG